MLLILEVLERGLWQSCQIRNAEIFEFDIVGDSFCQNYISPIRGVKMLQAAKLYQEWVDFVVVDLPSGMNCYYYVREETEPEAHLV